MYENIVAQDIGTEPFWQFVGVLVLLLVLLLGQFGELFHWVRMVGGDHKDTSVTGLRSH